MTAATPPDDARRAAEFRRSAEAPAPGLVAEFVAFLSTTKRWWLTPVIVVLLLAAALVALSGTAAGPFLYSLW